MTSKHETLLAHGLDYGAGDLTPCDNCNASVHTIYLVDDGATQECADCALAATVPASERASAALRYLTRNGEADPELPSDEGVEAAIADYDGSSASEDQVWAAYATLFNRLYDERVERLEAILDALVPSLSKVEAVASAELATDEARRGLVAAELGGRA